MEKENIYKFLYLVSMLLSIAFCIRLGVDYTQYDIITNTTPFYMLIILRIIEFIIPSIILFVIARASKKKYSKNNKTNTGG